ncbi:hypothetical protein acdb102_47270 [Acidothermaceae bacterium B102]|nr:hypothetical protein acdb102_47270 [Acidothermaceae bacterium B102]
MRVQAFILWCGFFGAWLLVAGPIYQAALELGEEQFDREQLHVAHAGSPSVSPWWWLLPPVGYWLQKRRAQRARREIMAQWTPEQLEGFIALTNKATGWIFVAGGATLLATTETWNLVEHYAWETWVFWVVTVVMLWLSAANTALRLRRRPARVTHE